MLTPPRASRAGPASEALGPDRDRRVERVIWVEGGANALVLVLKLVAGFATGSWALLGDALHSLTDVANNGVALAVLRVASRPPDADHPYGHRKFETLAVFVLASLLTVLAFELALGAVRRGEPHVVGSSWVLGLMLGVLGVNFALSAWQGRWARRLDSDLLRADARHTFSDVLTTIAAIVGWQGASRGLPWLDTAAALLVCAVILVLAFGLFRRSIPVLVDQVSLEPQPLVDAALGVPGSIGVRSVRSRWVGRQAAVDLVLVVAPELTTAESHQIASRVEDAIRQRFPVESVTVHVEPPDTANTPGA